VCGRYRLKDPKAALDFFGVKPAFEIRPRYNIAPTRKIPVVTGADEIEEMIWGITPQWAKGTSKALINARSESVREKRSFKSSFTKRRCLIPADGFYEWSSKGEKQPYLFTMKNEAPFAIGGFWDEIEEMNRCCLLTTAGNAVLEPVHDRMPVIVRPDDWEEWFSPGELSDTSFHRITTPYAADEMSALAVSAVVNNARVDDPRCCEAWDCDGVPQKLVIERGAAGGSEAQQRLMF
jgi:putative SOS response-associated peptidase YedK